MENRASACAVGRKPKQFSMNCNVYLWVIRSYTHTFCEMSFYWEPMLIVHIFYGCVYTPSLPHSPSEHIPFTSFDQVYSQTVEMPWKWNWNCTHTQRERRKLGMNEWMVCTQYLNIIVETAFFTIEACNLILSIFALSEQTYHLKLKVCVRVECVLSISLSLSWNCSKMWKHF